MDPPTGPARPTPTPGSPGDQALHLRARLLPGGLERDLWIRDGVVTYEPLDGARTVALGGWMMPSLVDAHVHLGVTEIGGPLSLDVLEEELTALTSSGVGAVRVLGSPSPIPAEILDRPGQPLIQHAGVPLAAPGRFFPGWGRCVADDELAAAAADQTTGQWVKIIADWFDESGGYSASFTPEALHGAVEAAHRAGRRVAVHTQSADAGAAALRAGADSIEHGLHLAPELVDALAERGGVLVPTGTVFEHLAPSMQDPSVPPPMRRWFHEGRAAHAGLVRRAADAGVTILVGTDLLVGHLIDEIQWLIDAGLHPEQALGGASWIAREVCGFPSLREGERADLLWLEHDPREDIDVLRDPDLVVLDGAVVRQ